MSVLILTQPSPPEATAQAVRAIAPDIVCRTDLGQADLADIDAVMAWRLPEGLASQLPRLGLVCSVGAGVEKVLASDLPAEIPVTRIVDGRVNQGIAQYVALMALRHARELPRYERQQKEHAWLRQAQDMVQPRVGLLGVGSTGVVIAQALQALGFMVRGWSTRPRPDLLFPCEHGAGGLDVCLAQADILVLALPLTPDTAGLLNKSSLAKLPRGAYVINVGRGGHLVEQDLIALVRAGQLAGAALDVQQQEPMPAEHPLWEVPGITITPHIAAQASLASTVAQFVECYRALQAGQPIPRCIDRRRGY